MLVLGDSTEVKPVYDSDLQELSKELLKFVVCAGRYTLFSEWRRNFPPLRYHKDYLSLTLTELYCKIELA